MKAIVCMICCVAGMLMAEPLPFYPQAKTVKRVELEAKPAGTTEIRSLNGTWKLSPLVSSKTAFADDVDFDKGYAAPSFNDSGWLDAPVPRNWYGVVKGMQKTAEPHVKGWYRRTFTLSEADIADRQILIAVQRLGYEGVFFINGKQVPKRHFGDFVVTEIDITPYVKAGVNTVAIRVRTDQGPAFGRSEPITHTYGSQWGMGNIKGGLWGDVDLRLEPRVRVSKMELVPNVTGWNGAQKSTVTIHLALSAQKALPQGLRLKAEVLDAMKGHGLACIGSAESVMAERITVPLRNPVLWTLDNPQLYYAVLTVLDSNGQAIARRVERYGQREFAVKGGKFYLNGEQIYLFGENIPSASFGGDGRTDAETEKAMEEFLMNIKSVGNVMVRTSHMPILPKALDIADEIGLMVFHEWAWSFSRNIDEAAFEAANTDEIARYVEVSHNHPSVTMWSLGNEVMHGGRPEVARQFDKQYDTVKACDLQKRPISIFSGSAGWGSYGRTKLKTDVHDLHTYVGLSHPWVNRNGDAASIYNGLLEIYEEKETLSRPLVAWENVGFSWGWMYDKNFRDGNVDDYLKYAAKDTSWGQPRGIGFTGCFPLAEALTVGQNVPMELYCRRVLELYRLDKNYQGFAPWSGYPKPWASTLWNQLVLPTIHKERNMPPRHFYLNEESPWTIEIVNSGNVAYDHLRLVVSLVRDGNEEVAVVGSWELPPLAAQSHCLKDIGLALKQVSAGRYQMRLKLLHDNTLIGQNYYDVYAQERAVTEAPVTAVRPVYVLDTGAETNVQAVLQRLNLLKIEAKTVKAVTALPTDSVLIVPPELDLQMVAPDVCSAIGAYARHGGFVLVFEQNYTQSFRFSGLPQLGSYPLSFSDIVVPSHPIFQGLDRHHFDTWDNDDGSYVTKVSYRTINENVLVARGPRLGRKDVGMTVLEGTIEKGRILCSQLNVFRSLPYDCVAATYLRNLLAYACAAKTWQAETRPYVMREALSYSSLPARTKQIDLRPYVNRSFTDETDGDMKGGWTDQGDNDFRMMPLGLQKLGGIPFDIINPAQNNGKSCIVLAGTEAPKFPQFVKNIVLKGHYARLFFLHTAAWGSAKEVGSYRFNYADGTTETLQLVGTKNINDWWHEDELPNAVIGLKAFQKAHDHYVYLFVTSWENPHPEKELVSFDFLSPLYNEANAIDWAPSSTGVPILIAVTGEQANLASYDLLGGNFNGLAAVADKMRGVKPIIAEQKEPLVLKAEFPEAPTNDDSCIFWFFKMDKEAISKPFSCLTLRIKSNVYHQFRVCLPKDDWKQQYNGNLQLIGDNQYHVYRMYFGSVLNGTDGFPPQSLRGELFLYARDPRDGNRPKIQLELDKAILE